MKRDSHSEEKVSKEIWLIMGIGFWRPCTKYREYFGERECVSLYVRLCGLRLKPNKPGKKKD